MMRLSVSGPLDLAHPHRPCEPCPLGPLVWEKGMVPNRVRLKTLKVFLLLPEMLRDRETQRGLFFDKEHG